MCQSASTPGKSMENKPGSEMGDSKHPSSSSAEVKSTSCSCWTRRGWCCLPAEKSGEKLPQVTGGPSPSVRQAMAVAGLSVGCALDGMVIAYSSPAIPSLLEQDSDIQINHHHASWIGSIHTLGAVLGCLIAVPAMRCLGRKGATLAIMAVAYLLGFLLIGGAVNVEMIITGRFLGGVGLGLTLSITPVYLVEVSNLQIRGMLGVVPPLFTQIGLLATYVAGCWVDWRNLALSGAICVVPFVILVWFIPESPVYLASVGRIEEAKHALKMLGRANDSVMILKEFAASNNVSEESASWRQYLSPSVIRPFFACLGLMFFFQATGYNTIIAYSVILFRESGQTIHEHVATGITGGMILASAMVALGLARVAPRKTLLIASSLGTASSLLSLGTYYFLKTNRGPEFTTNWSWVPLVSMAVLITFFMIGYGALSWTVMAEILPLRVRGNLYPLTVAFTWVANFGFAKSFVYLQRGIGSSGAFWLYSGLTLLGALFVRFCLPETRHRSPEKVAAFFSPGSGVSRAGSQVTVVSSEVSSLDDSLA